ncbi:hypothetical protein TRSC58_07304 [Trypanosoma rangeli SC58]|uniref:Uncharacterized protein n=1 Tax=Trypanosoma rangeli SC58 TaxID=429131 RepID=A0A061IT55_TRYRA|nr:hypothetical protein TRSC58_07304 [Trypanosoma rangeli SC58]
MIKQRGRRRKKIRGKQWCPTYMLICIFIEYKKIKHNGFFSFFESFVLGVLFFFVFLYLSRRGHREHRHVVCGLWLCFLFFFIP